MQKYSESYNKEALYQERKANERMLNGFKIFLGAYFLIWLLCMVDFFDMDKNLMSIAFILLAPTLLIPIGVGEKADLTDTRLKYFFLVMICISTSFIAMVLTVHAELLYVMPLLFAAQCGKRKALWITYGVNFVTMLISILVGFYHGICDLNILIVSNHTYEYYIQSVTDGLIHLPLNHNAPLSIILYEVLPRGIILLAFTLIIQFVVIRCSEDSAKIADLIYKKETDCNTGVYNKNKYEEMADEYYPDVKRIGAIFWDLNNLKKTNDKYGHTVGDKIIYAFSQCLVSEGDERYRVYRLGGDEFVVIVDNPQSGEIQTAIDHIIERINSCEIEGGIKITSAVGWSMGEGKTTRRVVEVADANMYANKVQGKEGRNR